MEKQTERDMLDRISFIFYGEWHWPRDTVATYTERLSASGCGAWQTYHGNPCISTFRYPDVCVLAHRHRFRLCGLPTLINATPPGTRDSRGKSLAAVAANETAEKMEATMQTGENSHRCECVMTVRRWRVVNKAQ